MNIYARSTHDEFESHYDRHAFATCVSYFVHHSFIIDSRSSRGCHRDTVFETIEPVHTLLRRRRKELSLMQAELAETLRVSPECIVLWECGRRRMELSKLPRLAAALQIDPKELCAKALAEFYPSVYAALFGNRT